jgi:putative hemolysin
MDDVLTGPAGECRPTLTSELRGWRRRLVEVLPGVSHLNRLFDDCERRPEPRFVERALAALGVGLDVDDVARIPAAGPAIIAANHPTGALDGLALLSLVGHRRRDVKLLANDWLASITPLAGELLPVDAFGDGRRANAAPMRAAVRWLRDGHALVVFPAGVVSHLRPGAGVIVDPAWQTGVARLARLTAATLVPCFIDGRNSALFQALGLLNPWLRTALLPRELLRRRGSRVCIRVGREVPPKDVLGVGDAELTRRLRELVYALRDHQRPPSRGAQAEVRSLPLERTLVATDEYSVFWCRASEAPALMQEIGRAREQTFRAVGEGTGRAVDTDRFDADYLHLCLWDRHDDALAGAYRMRVVDEALRPEALYTHTLFDFDRRLVASLAPGLELGRAFIVPAHQRKHQPLLLLWSGIAKFAAAHPRIRHLFGAVSVGASYSAAARTFLAAYLRRHALDALRAPLVAPRHPLSGLEHADAGAPVDPQRFSATVQALDHGGKGLPVLLRQYLKLQARVLDFSVDPAFGDVLDVLVTVDLPAAPPSLLRRYMGEGAAEAYLRQHHGSTPDAVGYRRGLRRSA